MSKAVPEILALGSEACYSHALMAFLLGASAEYRPLQLAHPMPEDAETVILKKVTIFGAVAVDQQNHQLRSAPLCTCYIGALPQ